MGFPYGLILFGAFFFGFLAVLGVVKAYRQKEKAYYLTSMVGFIMMVVLLLLFLNEFVVAMTLMGLTAILSLAGLPMILEVQERELVKQLQETDLSASLAPKDFITWKGWFKLASRWGLRKAMSLYSLFSIGVGGAALFTLSTFFSVMPVTWAAMYTLIVGIVSTVLFHRQVGKALERSCLEHETRLGGV